MFDYIFIIHTCTSCLCCKRQTYVSCRVEVNLNVYYFTLPEGNCGQFSRILSCFTGFQNSPILLAINPVISTTLISPSSAIEKGLHAAPTRSQLCSLTVKNTAESQSDTPSPQNKWQARHGLICGATIAWKIIFNLI